MSEAVTMPLTEKIHRFVETQWLLFQEWLGDGSLFGVNYLGYLLLLLIVLLIIMGGIFLLQRMGRLIWLYALVLTPKARRAEVLSHVDGDTVRVSSPNKDDKSQLSIRLIGVDTPESRRSLYMDIAPFGKQSAEYTKTRLPKGKKVILLYDQTPEDKFGRQLAYIFLTNGEFFNASLVKNGYAWADRHPPNLRYAEHFEKLQAKAEKRQLGLWQIYDENGKLRSEYKKTSEYKQFLKQHPPREKK